MYVLDASVVMKWFVEEEYTKKALRFRNEYEAGTFEQRKNYLGLRQCVCSFG